MESPILLATAQGGRAFVRTIDHNMYKIEDGDLYGKISPNNNMDNPQHIIHAQFKSGSGYKEYEYFMWSPITHDIEIWTGNFLDKNN